MGEFRPAKKRASVSVGESVRVIRELQGLSQNQLAERTAFRKPRFRPLRTIVYGLVSSVQRCSPARLSVIRQCWCFQGGSTLILRPNSALDSDTGTSFDKVDTST